MHVNSERWWCLRGKRDWGGGYQLSWRCDDVFACRILHNIFPQCLTAEPDLLLFSASKIDFDILLQIVGSASHCLKGTKARVQIVFPNCGVNNEILGLHKLVGKQWNLSKFGGRGKRMALSTQCLRSTNGLPSSSLPSAAASAALHTSLLSWFNHLASDLTSES